MADENLKTHLPETATHPPPSDETEPPLPTPEPQEPDLESIPEPPLASVELHKDELVPPVQPESLKEAVTVVEKDTPLLSPPTDPPLTEEHVTTTATTETATASSQPLSAALAQPQESESKAVEKSSVGPGSWRSFKEESNKVADLSPSETLALNNLKTLLTEAVQSRVFAKPEGGSSDCEQVSIWGVPLLEDERTDVVLLKFLRARDFKEKDAFAMLKNTIKWRSDFNVDDLLKEDLGDDLEKVVFMHGHDKEGHPVCYNVYGEFQNKELYTKTFGDEEKRTRFLRWRIQFLERSIRKLDFWPGGVNTLFQVTDLKNSPGPGKRELRIATKQALQVLQDNYPEFVAKQVFINVPWWHLAFYTMISPFLTQRTRSKFVFASPAKTAEMLFKYVTPEQVPTQYGGLSVDFCECNPEFTVDDPVTEIIIKPTTKQTVEIIVNEQCILVWEIRVVGWEVSYSAEYVPNAENAYTVIIQKARKLGPTDEPVISSSFKITDLGKILLTIDNPTAKKKKLLYRYKVAPIVD